MKLLWSMYARQSPRAMFVSLGVDPGKFTTDLERHSLELDEIVDDMTTDHRIQRLFADDRVTNRLREMLQLRRSNLVAYLGETLLVEHDQAVVVDVGWRGSIQDNLARVLPDVEFVGCYLGLFAFLNPQPANVRKRGVAFDGNLGDDFGFAEPQAAVETPWSADIASAIDYVVSDSGVRVVTAEQEEDRAADQIEVFQRALVEAVPAAFGFFSRHGLSPLHMRGPLGDRLRQYYLDPWGGVADIWFDSFHDDTFGVLNETPFKTPEPARQLLWSDQPAHQIERAASSMWALGWERWLPNHSMALTRLLIDEQWALSDESDDESDDDAGEEDLREDGPAGSEA